jgi:hypothetical protein
VEHQVSLQVGETLKAKNDFEQKAKESGHKITNYHADKTPIQAEEFFKTVPIKDKQLITPESAPTIRMGSPSGQYKLQQPGQEQ